MYDMSIDVDIDTHTHTQTSPSPSTLIFSRLCSCFHIPSLHKIMNHLISRSYIYFIFRNTFRPNYIKIILSATCCGESFGQKYSFSVLMSLMSVGPIGMEMKHFILIIYDETQTGLKCYISPLEKRKLVI